MRSLTYGLAIAGIVVLTSADVIRADGRGDGRGSGLNRAAQAARKGPGGGGVPGSQASGGAIGRHGHSGLNHSAMNRAGQSVPRNAGATTGSTQTTRMSASGLKHSRANSSPGFQQGPATTPPVGPGREVAEGRFEQIKDQRFEQAEHLRQIGDSNGNERLADTADRMETNAARQFTARNESPTPDDASSRSLLPRERPQERPSSPRTSWLPSWLRGSEQR